MSDPTNTPPPPEPPQRHGFWRRFLDNWYILPLLHFILFWGGCTASVGTSGWIRDGFSDIFYGMMLLGELAAVLLPLLVAVQLARRQWRTALKTALFSALVLAPFIWLCIVCRDLRQLC